MRLFSADVLKMGALVAALFAAHGEAVADTPASAVTTSAVPVGGTYPYVSPGGEGWFNVGGYCKVVDAASTARQTPVFIDGDPSQWESWRQTEASRPTPGITVSTCCLPQANIATLCTEAGAIPQEVSRQYGKVGEVDTVTASCVDQWGKSYQDQVNVECEVAGGGADGPDAQGVWAETGADATSGCSANAYTSACTVSCGGGTQQTFDSCGHLTATTACNMQACCTPRMVTTGCSGSCGAGAGSQTVYDANNCPGSPDYVQSCTVGPVASCNAGPYQCSQETTAIATGYDCAGGCWNATSYTYQSCLFSSVSADRCSCDTSAEPYPGSGLVSTNDTCLSAPIPGQCPPPPPP